MTTALAGWLPVAVLGAAMVVASPYAGAARLPRALPTDARVRQVIYDPNQVYEIVGTYGYQTALEFGMDEVIRVVSLGDSIAWQAVPYRNRLFLKPVEPNAATNLTVITNRRTYFFGLRGGRGGAATYLVRFVYPGQSAGIGRWADRRGDGPVQERVSSCMAPASEPGPMAGQMPVNRRYASAGDRSALGLRDVCDDGQFTYFRFEREADIPAVYVVGADGTEALVNTRREGDYLVVERRAPRFTLRSGRVHLCVMNDAIATPAGNDASPAAAGRGA